MSTVTVTLESPTSGRRSVQVRPPVGSATIRQAAKTFLGDDSWDVTDLREEGSDIVAARPNADLRPYERKKRLARLQDDNGTLISLVQNLQIEIDGLKLSNNLLLQSTIEIQTTRLSDMELAIAVADINEKHESTDRCLRSFNDIIFDTKRPPRTEGNRRVMGDTAKEKLKNYGLTYITRLLDMSFLPEKKRILPSDVATARNLALGILTKEELELCGSLLKQFNEGRMVRNHQQHPIPDTATALERTRAAAGRNIEVLKKLLDSNPRRLQNKNDDPDEPRELFAPVGTYVSVAKQREKLNKIRESREALLNVVDERKKSNEEVE
ncbi:hypothetical protein K438DRAFT_1852447 [Mycena galopus ATCC 62051]|nr:hypothetical protein K438DRAFT_1852447 [Mycena galopus ATCC 62051]